MKWHFFHIKNNYFRFDLKDWKIQKINEIPDSAANIEYNTESGDIAFTIKNNLYYSCRW